MAHPLPRRLVLTALATAASMGGGHAKAQATQLATIWMGWPEQHVRPLFEMFSQAHPEIDPVVTPIPFDNLLQALEVQLGARTPLPDIYMADGSLTASYAVRGHALDLTSVFGPEQDRFTAAGWDQGTWRNRLYTAPLHTSSPLLYINRRLFAAAGIDIPAADPAQRLTWEQTVEIGRRLTDRSRDTWGLVIEQSARPYQILPIMQSHGATVISEDGLSVTGHIDSPRFVEAAQFYADLFNRHAISPKGVFDLALAREVFTSGRAGMLIAGTWALDLFDRVQGLDYVAVPHPSFAAGRPVTCTGSWHIALNPRSRNRDQQLTLLRYFMSPGLQQAWFRLRTNPPVLKATYETMPEVFSSPAWRIVLHELNTTAVPRPRTPGFREYEDVLHTAFRDIQGGAEVAPRLQRATRDIDRELLKYRS